MASKTNPVGWFEIPTKDLGRAKDFYQRVFGLELELAEMGPLKMAWFPMSSDAPGAAGALVLGPDYVPSRQGTLVYIHADDIDATLARVRAEGGKVLTPRTSIGQYGWIGVFEDTEGNRVALHSGP